MRGACITCCSTQECPARAHRKQIHCTVQHKLSCHRVEEGQQGKHGHGWRQLSALQSLIVDAEAPAMFAAPIAA